VNVVDVKSAGFGSAIATLNFDINNRGNSTQELVLKYWYSADTLYEFEQSVTLQAGESITKMIEIPFNSAGVYNVIIEAESADGTIATTDIEINVAWLAVYLYIIIAGAMILILISVVLVIRALRSSKSFVTGGSRN
jgi:uncharacterized membrane protein